MKPIISAVALAGMFSLAACNNSALQEKEAALRIQQQQIEMMNLELAKKHVIDSMNEVSRMQYTVSTMPNAAMMTPTAQYVNQAPRVVYVRQAPAARTRTRSRSYARSSQRTYAANTQPVVYQQAPAKKRGWSAKAKGAVIGGAGGAVAGAIINGRNRPVGALIGGILGAGAGTGIGAIIDKKNGR
jgi:hypothetical protein